MGDSKTTVSINSLGKRNTAPRKGATVVFLCDDLKLTVADLKKKGVKFSGDIQDVGPVWMASFSDPDGNVM